MKLFTAPSTYYYCEPGEALRGPLEIQPLAAALKVGKLSAKVLVSKTGKDGWTSLLSVIETGDSAFARQLQQPQSSTCEWTTPAPLLVQETPPKPSQLDDAPIKCPACDSSQIHAERRGWNIWTGFINSGKIKITCLKCGHRFNPGKPREAIVSGEFIVVMIAALLLLGVILLALSNS